MVRRAVCILVAMLAAVAANALECEKDILSVRADAGNYAYGEIACSSDMGLFARYAGNLSERVSVFPEEKGSGKYRIRLVADARSSNIGTYRGEIILRDRKGSEYVVRTRIRVGEPAEDRLSLSARSLSFEIKRFNRTECAPVEIENSGNAELRNLRVDYETAWITSEEVGNKSWISVTNITEKIFSPGEKKTLWICVNTNDDYPTVREREARIGVYAESDTDSRRKLIKETLTVSLLADLDSLWEQRYDLLKDQHQMLRKSYNSLTAYRNALYAADNGTNATAGAEQYSYSGLAQLYAELKNAYAEAQEKLSFANASSIDSLQRGYDNLAESYRLLESGYSKLLRNVSGKVPVEKIENLTKERDAAKAELDALQKEIEHTRDLLEEKEALILSFSIEKGNGTSEGTKAAGMVTFLSTQYTPYAALFGLALLLLSLLAFYYLRRESKAKKKTLQPAPPAPKEEAKEQDGSLKAKEQQKEALRQLLLQKLAEKAAEKNGKV